MAMIAAGPPPDPRKSRVKMTRCESETPLRLDWCGNHRLSGYGWLVCKQHASIEEAAQRHNARVEGTALPRGVRKRLGLEAKRSSPPSRLVSAHQDPLFVHWLQARPCSAARVGAAWSMVRVRADGPDDIRAPWGWIVGE